MIADSGTRLVVADGSTVSSVRAAADVVRRALAGEIGDVDADILERAAVPVIAVVGEDPAAGEQSFDQLRATAGPGGPAAAGPREAGRAALHQRHLRTPAGGDAHPSGAARQPAPDGPGRAADDPRRRRRPRRAPALPRLRPQRRARRGAPAPRQAGARGPVRPGRHARPDRRRGLQRGAGGAAGVRALDAGPEPRRAAGLGADDAVRVGPAVDRGDRGVHRADRHPRPPGLRPHRGGSRRHQHPGQPGPPERLRRRGPPRDRDPPGRRPRRGSRGRGPGRDPDPRRQPLQRLLAGRLRRAGRRTAGGPRATSASSTAPATCSWSTGSRT